MAKYKVQAPDGSIIELEGPENATDAQIVQAAQAAYAKKQQPPETTAAGVAGAVTRGVALPAAGAAVGAALGAPFGGVGAIPGAIAGAGAATAAQLLGDPIVDLINKSLGTQYSRPSDEMAKFLTSIGVANPNTETEKIIQAAAAGAAGAGGTVALGKAVQAAAGAASPVTQAVGQALASQPGLQIAGGAGAGAAGQAAQESGAGTLGQIAASLGGALAPVGAAAVPGVVRGVRAARRQPAAQPQRVAPAVAPMPEAAAMPEAPAPQVTAAAAPETAIAAPAAAPVMEETAGGVGDVLNLARRAASIGPGSTAAKAKLAELAQVNPEAKAAAERLQIDLPFDVLADNPQVRNAVGLTRSLVAGEAIATWERTVRRAIERADEITQQFDANFVAGRPSTGAVSQKVLDSLKTSRQNLEDNAREIYMRINGTDTTEGLIKKKNPVELNRLRQTLDQITEEVGIDGMTKEEKRLLSMISGKGVDETGEAIGPVTYGRLLREKNLIGKALKSQKSPYDSLDEATLKRLYGALAQDQLDNAEAIAGTETRRQLRIANLLTEKKKALEKRIVGAFGTDIDGSIAQRMQTAITTASRGDAAAFNKLLKVVPDELQKETLATALASVTMGKTASKVGGTADEVAFSFNEFANIYRGLRANPPVYAQMVKVMGPEWDKASRDLYQISKRIADAEKRIIGTGKANQILAQDATDGLIGSVMQAGVSQRLASLALAQVPGGPLLNTTVIDYMRNTKGAGVQAASKLFASPEFQELAIQTATQGGQPTNKAIISTAMSKAFNDFAKEINLPKDINARVQWLQAAIQSGRQIQQEPQEQ